jgi:hypothetical protein
VAIDDHPAILDAIDRAVSERETMTRVERVTLLGSGETLDHQASFEVHDAGGLDDNALGELAIRAPEPTDALIDVVAIDFAASLPRGLLERQDRKR